MALSKPVNHLSHRGRTLTAGKAYRVPMRPKGSRMFGTRGLAKIVKFHDFALLTWRWAGQRKEFRTSLDDFVRMIQTGRLPSAPEFR